MTKDKIIELARIAGVRDDENIFEFSQYKYLERFVYLVSVREREACAKMCAEDSVQAIDFTGGTFIGGYFAEKIKARGEE